MAFFVKVLATNMEKQYNATNVPNPALEIFMTLSCLF